MVFQRRRITDSALWKTPSSNRHVNQVQFLNTLRPQFMQLVRPRIINKGSGSNVDLYRYCYLWWSIQHLYQQPLINLTDPGHSRSWDKVQKEVLDSKSTWLRFRVETLSWFESLCKPIFSETPHKPKFLWMGFVFFFPARRVARSFAILHNSWIKNGRAHQPWSNLYVVVLSLHCIYTHFKSCMTIHDHFSLDF